MAGGNRRGLLGRLIGLQEREAIPEPRLEVEQPLVPYDK